MTTDYIFQQKLFEQRINGISDINILRQEAFNQNQYNVIMRELACMLSMQASVPKNIELKDISLSMERQFAVTSFKAMVNDISDVSALRELTIGLNKNFLGVRETLEVMTAGNINVSY